MSRRVGSGCRGRPHAPLWTAASRRRAAKSFLADAGNEPAGEKRVFRVPGGVPGFFPGKKRRKTGRIPRFWRPLTSALAGSGPVAEKRVNGWLLVLAAKKVPHIFFPSGERPGLYVPPLWEGPALHEIRAFEAERPVPAFTSPAHNNAGGVLCVFLLLLVWHGLRFHWFSYSLPSSLFPFDAAEWPARFGLDVYKATVRHEWWRAITALTLHADDRHLFSNLGFGLFFFIPLCRRAGVGYGFALALAAGVAGNVCNALMREAFMLSIGFSTSLFAAVGALCALTAGDLVRYSAARLSAVGTGGALLSLGRREVLPIAAGLALLGILGGGGEARTDYGAHIWGFVCGAVLAAATLPLDGRLRAQAGGRQKAVQLLLLAGSLLGVAAAWGYAVA